MSVASSSQERVPPQTAIAIQCDGHPDIILREHPTGSVVFKVPNGAILGMYEEQGEYARVVVVADPETHGWAKRSNLQLNVRRAIACQREGHPDVVLRVSPAGPLRCKVPNGTVCCILKDNDEDIQVWTENDAATIGWIKRWNLQLDGVGQPSSPLVAVDQPLSSFDDFESPQSLCAYCVWAHVCWLKVSYLMTVERLPRCQDTPSDAFARSQELEDWSIPIDWHNRHLVSISHPWWARGEPDPEGQQLASIKKPCWGGLTDFGYTPAAIFYDFTCLPQQPGRSTEQEMYFKRALEYMHLLYVHLSTLVLLLDQPVPEHAANPTPYMDRGWCVFERKAAHLKPTSSRGYGVYSIKSQVHGETEHPETPHEFRARLGSLAFAAAGTDRALVGDLYEKIYLKMFPGPA